MELNIIDDENQYVFRPIHYLGSKLRLLEEIDEVVTRYDPSMGIVCDLFAGSGTVSRFLSSKRGVISVDIQGYSRVLAEALLLKPEVKIDSGKFIDQCTRDENTKKLHSCFKELLEYEEESFLKAEHGDFLQLALLIDKGSILDFERGNIQGVSEELSRTLCNAKSRLADNDFLLLPNAMMCRYYGGLYFSFRQTLEMDSILEVISKYEGNIKSILMAALLSTASEVVNTIGKQFAQPIQLFDKSGNIKERLFPKILKDRNLKIYDVFKYFCDYYQNIERSPFEHEVISTDFLTNNSFLRDSKIKIIYADPPYTRYHYSRYYHVLETMVLRDSPEVSLTDRGDKTKLSKGKYRVDRYQSQFCIASQAEAAFKRMFEVASSTGVPLILSYSPFDPTQAVSPRLQTINQLVDLAKEYYSSVEIISIDKFKHSKLNSTKNLLVTNSDAEVLICCRK